MFTCAGRSSAVLGVSQAVQDTARLHQAAKLAAAVALPPPPAASAPGMVGNVGRATVADLFTATPPVFGPTSAGELLHCSFIHPCIHASIHPSIQSSMHSPLTHSLPHSLTHSLTSALTHSTCVLPQGQILTAPSILAVSVPILTCVDVF